jgi:hypothetical protein
MKIRQLVNHWQSTGDDSSPKTRLHIDISTQDAARLAALADLFPALKAQEIIAELLHTALNEVEEAFPYIKGTNKWAKMSKVIPFMKIMAIRHASWL